MSGKPIKKPRQLSYSSSCTFQGCPRKYQHYKILKTPEDKDIEDDALALRVGSAYHYVLEHCNHEKAAFKMELLEKAVADEKLDPRVDMYRIYAMLQAYFKMHSKSKLVVVHCEMKLETETFIGFIDAIMVDANGNWWIVDLKTAASVRDDLYARLHMDQQLNLYAGFAPTVAENLKLDLAKFMGCRYRVVQKTKGNPKNESMAEFSNRIKIKSYDIEVPIENMDPNGAAKSFMSIQNQIAEMEENNHFPQNLGSCFQYFSPCKWWSQCYGEVHTKCAQKFVQVFDQSSMIDQTRNLIEESEEDLLEGI